MQDCGVYIYLLKQIGCQFLCVVDVELLLRKGVGVCLKKVAGSTEGEWFDGRPADEADRPAHQHPQEGEPILAEAGPEDRVWGGGGPGRGCQ